MKIILTLFIVFSNILSFSQVKDDMKLELTYSIYCQESLIGKELVIDSCFEEKGTFEFDKPFIKHNETTYLVEVLEKYDGTTYMIALSKGKKYLFVFNNLKPKEGSIAVSEISEKDTKVFVYAIDFSKASIELKIKEK
jgi:prenyltransferase beta subunit